MLGAPHVGAYELSQVRADVDSLLRAHRGLHIELTRSPMTQLTVNGTMDADDYTQLCVEVQQLADDVAEIREALLFIVDKLKV